MIRITAELIPLGYEDKSRTMGKILLWNDATSGKETVGNYKYKIFDKNNRKYADGRVVGFSRKKDGVMKLILLILKDHFGELND